MPTLHVVIPFYNEAATLEPCVRRVAGSVPAGWSPHLVLVDDHSDDGAARATEAAIELMRRLGHRHTLLRHDVNRGKGAAVRSGFDAVLAASPDDDDLVVIQDADLEYDPGDFARLMKPLLEGCADAVIGDRWQGDSRPGAKAAVHAWANRALTALSNLMTGYRLADMECCYKMMTVRVVRSVRPWLSESRYGVEPQLVAALARLRTRVVQVPVAYDPRSVAEGKKIRWTDGVRAVWVIARERRRRRPPPGPERGRG